MSATPEVAIDPAEQIVAAAVPGDRPDAAVALGLAAAVMAATGPGERARRVAEEALARSRRHPAPTNRHFAHHGLAVVGHDPRGAGLDALGPGIARSPLGIDLRQAMGGASTRRRRATAARIRADLDALVRVALQAIRRTLAVEDLTPAARRDRPVPRRRLGGRRP